MNTFIDVTTQVSGATTCAVATLPAAARQLPLGKMVVSQNSEKIVSVKIKNTPQLDEIITKNMQALNNPDTQRETLKSLILQCHPNILTQSKRKKILAKMAIRGLHIKQKTMEDIIHEINGDINTRFARIYNQTMLTYPKIDRRRTLVFMAEALIKEEIFITTSDWQEKLRHCGTVIPHVTFLATCWKIADTIIPDCMALWITANRPGNLTGKVVEQMKWLEKLIAAFPDESITWYLLMKAAFVAGINPQADTVTKIMGGVKEKLTQYYSEMEDVPSGFIFTSTLPVLGDLSKDLIFADVTQDTFPLIP